MKHNKFLLFAFLFINCLTFDLSANDPFDSKTDQFRLEMIKLWEDHIVWTRNVIISSIDNLGDLNDVTQRLLENQDDIGDAFKPYYGNKKGKKLSKLLREHILIAADIITDAIANNMEKFDKDYKKWKENAQDIAKFLSKINPNWSKKELKNMLYEHLKLTTGEVSSRLQDKWKDDIHFYDKNHVHMLMFADILTAGIIEQFPNKF